MAAGDALGPLPPLMSGWSPGAQPAVDTATPHVARVYDYFLGGKDHFQADRDAAALILRGNPAIREACRQQRGFLRRAVRHLAESGTDQFLDIGTGLPTAQNTHQVARAANPAARVVYVDNDPIVLAHARVLMPESADAGTAFLGADIREPGRLLADPALGAVLDLDRPVAVLVVGLLHFLPDHEYPARILRTLMAAVPSGSHLVISHGSADVAPESAHAAASAYRQSQMPCQIRSAPEVLALLPGLDLLEPGLVPTYGWRPDEPVAGHGGPARPIVYAAVARKP